MALYCNDKSVHSWNYATTFAHHIGKLLHIWSWRWINSGYSNDVRSIFKEIRKCDSQFSFFITSLPFSSKTLSGYLMYTFVQDTGVFCFIFTAMSTICFFIGSCWLFISFAKDITNGLSSLNVKRSPNPNNSRKLKENFHRFVHIYTVLKQLSWSNFNYCNPQL